MIRRIHHERTGYSYFREQRFVEAADSYRLALRYAEGRGQLKVEANLALACYLAPECGPGDLGTLKNELRRIRATAEDAGYPDVVAWATQDLCLIDQNRLGELEPFEDS